jgi:hypothetical protein
MVVAPRFIVNLGEDESGFKASCARGHPYEKVRNYSIVISEILGRSIVNQSDLGERRHFFFSGRVSHISYAAF